MSRFQVVLTIFSRNFEFLEIFDLFWIDFMVRLAIFWGALQVHFLTVFEKKQKIMKKNLENNPNKMKIFVIFLLEKGHSKVDNWSFMNRSPL